LAAFVETLARTRCNHDATDAGMRNPITGTPAAPRPPPAATPPCRRRAAWWMRAVSIDRRAFGPRQARTGLHVSAPRPSGD